DYVHSRVVRVAGQYLLPKTHLVSIILVLISSVKLLIEVLGLIEVVNEINELLEVCRILVTRIAGTRQVLFGSIVSNLLGRLYFVVLEKGVIPSCFVLFCAILRLGQGWHRERGH